MTLRGWVLTLATAALAGLWAGLAYALPLAAATLAFGLIILIVIIGRRG